MYKLLVLFFIVFCFFSCCDSFNSSKLHKKTIFFYKIAIVCINGDKDTVDYQASHESKFYLGVSDAASISCLVDEKGEWETNSNRIFEQPLTFVDKTRKDINNFAFLSTKGAFS